MVPLFLFVILFGLSMDYHVFILSRVRELHDRGMKTEDAVREGIASTASTVTSAAIVMVGVFACFATLDFLDLKELGVGLAVAVLIDATIVRASFCPHRCESSATGTGTCRSGSSGSRVSARRKMRQPASPRSTRKTRLRRHPSRSNDDVVGMTVGAAIAIGAAIGLVLGILIAVTTDVPLAPEGGLVLGGLVGWLSRRSPK